MSDADILIVEDDWLVANGLRELLRSDGFRVVGIAAKAEQVGAFVLEHRPTLALVDIHLGAGVDGVDLARDVLVPQGVRVVFTSAHADLATLTRASEAHASGFVVKPFTGKQLRAAIEMALSIPLAAEPVPPESLASHLATAQRALGKLAAAMGEGAPAAPESDARLRAHPLVGDLSQREREVLQELLEHRRVPAIAEHLGISPHTVRNHLKAIFAKLRVSSQQELLDQVMERRLTPDRPKRN